MTILETARLILRPPLMSDLSVYASFCASDRAQFVGGPYSHEQASGKLAAMIDQRKRLGYGRFVMTDRADGAPCGHAGLLHLDGTEAPEMTWSIWRADREGRGLAREAAEACLDQAFVTLGFPLILVRIAPGNHASLALVRRMGGQPCPDIEAPPWFPDALTFAFTPG